MKFFSRALLLWTMVPVILAGITPSAHALTNQCDLVKETTATTGTGTITLGGTAVTGYQTLDEAGCADDQTGTFALWDRGTGEKEVFRGVFDSNGGGGAGTITRAQSLYSTTGSPLSLSGDTEVSSVISSQDLRDIDVVDDTSPQLGGDLDTSGFLIFDTDGNTTSLDLIGSTSRHEFIYATNITNNSDAQIRINHTTSGTVVADFGWRLSVELEDAGGGNTTAFNQIVEWADPTDTSEDTRTRLQQRVGGSNVNILTLTDEIAIGGNINLSGKDITTTDSASVITLNPSVDATYTGITIDNDSTGTSAVASLEIISGTASSFLLEAIHDQGEATLRGSTLFTIKSDGGNLQVGTNDDNDIVFISEGGDETPWFIDGATGHFIPGADATYDIGTSSVGINDLHLGSGGIINFDGGDCLITHSANTLTLTGCTAVGFGGWDYDLDGNFIFDSTMTAEAHFLAGENIFQIFGADDADDPGLEIHSSGDSSGGPYIALTHNSGSPADGDTPGALYVYGGVDGEQMGVIRMELDDGSTGSEDTQWQFIARRAGADFQYMAVGNDGNFDIAHAIGGRLYIANQVDNGALGAHLSFYNESATPADGDIPATISVTAGADLDDVGQIRMELDDGTSGSEDTQWQHVVRVAGADLTVLTLTGTGATVDGDLTSENVFVSDQVYAARVGTSDTGTDLWLRTGGNTRWVIDDDTGDLVSSGGDIDLNGNEITDNQANSTRASISGSEWQFVLASNSATGPAMFWQHDSASPEDGDLPFALYVGAGADDEIVGQIRMELDDGSTGSEDTRWRFIQRADGADVEVLTLDFIGATVAGTVAASNDLEATDDVVVGDDILLASGAVLNWDGGDCLITHTANTLTLTGCTAVGFGGGSQTPWASDIDADDFNLLETGNIVSGHTAALTTFNNGTGTPGIQRVGTSAPSTSLGAANFEASSVGGARLDLAQSRGATIGDYTVVNQNDTLGIIFFSGSDGTNFARAAAIAGFSDGTPGDNDMPGRLAFQVAADASANPTTRMTIRADGSVIVGAATTTITTVLGSGSMRLYSTADAVSGVALELHHDDTTDANDIPGAINVYGGPDDELIGSQRLVILDPATTTEDTVWEHYTDVAGTDTLQVSLGDGVIIGPGTTFPGTGSLSLHKTATAGVGPVLTSRFEDGSATNDDQVFTLSVRGQDSGSASHLYADMIITARDVANNSEDGEWVFRSSIAGTQTAMLRFSTGVIIGNGTTMPGAEDLSIEGGDIEFGNAGTAGTDTTLSYAAAGELNIEGDRIKHAGRQTIPLTAGAGTLPIAGGIAACVPVAAFDSGSNDVFMSQCSFSAGTDNAIYFQFFFPKSAAETTDLVAQVDWTSATTTDATDDVIWTAAAVCFSNDDSINANAFPTVDTVTDTQTAAGDYLITGEITTITPAGTPAEGDGCVIRFTRDADNASDNFNGTAEAIQFRLYYVDNAASDD